MAYLWPTLPHPLSTNTPIFLVASLRPLFVQHIGGQKSYASDNPFSSVPSASLFFKSFQLTFQCAHLCHLKKKKKNHSSPSLLPRSGTSHHTPAQTGQRGHLSVFVHHPLCAFPNSLQSATEATSLSTWEQEANSSP